MDRRPDPAASTTRRRARANGLLLLALSAALGLGAMTYSAHALVANLDGGGAEGGTTTTRPRTVNPIDEPRPPDPSTISTTRPPKKDSKPSTTTTIDDESCDSYVETQYIPARSVITFERDGVSVDVQRVWHRQLTLEVTSSDGRYQHTRIDPDTTLYEGLTVSTSQLHLDWTWDYFKEEFVMEPGQVDTILRVYDCWTYTSGPTDVF